jgi:hypothetical protein
MVEFAIINRRGTALGYNGMTEDCLHSAEHLLVVVQDFVSNLLLFGFQLIIRELFYERATIFKILNIWQTRRILQKMRKFRPKKTKIKMLAIREWCQRGGRM